MALRQITVTEAARNFSELINRVHYQGAGALLVKGGKPMVKVMPVSRSKNGEELAVVWSKMPHLSVAEAERFDQDLKDSRSKLGPLVSKWE